jgi:hypothetical protein
VCSHRIWIFHQRKENLSVSVYLYDAFFTYTIVQYDCSFFSLKRICYVRKGSNRDRIPKSHMDIEQLVKWDNHLSFLSNACWFYCYNYMMNWTRICAMSSCFSTLGLMTRSSYSTAAHGSLYYCVLQRVTSEDKYRPRATCSLLYSDIQNLYFKKKLSKNSWDSQCWVLQTGQNFNMN